MFDKKKFALILKNISDTYENQRDFAQKSEINRTYLSQYMNMKIEKPPKPEILARLANASNGITTYEELMKVCGHIKENDIDSYLLSILGLTEQDLLEFNNNLRQIGLSENEKRIFQNIIDKLGNFHNNNNNSISNIMDYIKDEDSKTKLKVISAVELYMYYVKKIFEFTKIKSGKNNSQKNNANPKDSAIVFVYGSIPAGVPMECIEDIIDTEEIPVDMLRGGKQYFGLKVKGNSMEPEYLDGDTLILEKADDCESGDDCVVMVNGNDGTFKRVFKNENGIILQPLNSEYAPMVFTNEQIENLPVKVIGIVEEIRRKKRK